MTLGPPTRRRPRSRRRALALLVASGLALVGVLTLAVGWFTIGTTTLRASTTGEQPCLAAYEPGAGVRIRYELLPARAVCAWDVDGTRQEVVVASVPTGVTAGALALAGVGIAGTVAAVLPPRATRVAPAADGPTVPGPASGAS